MGMNLDSGELLAVKQVLIASNGASKEKAQIGSTAIVSSFWGKVQCLEGTEEWRAQWKEGALYDISVSGKPSTLQTSKKHNPKNVISIGEDIGPSKMTSSFGGKRNVSNAPEKEQAGCRKALSDLSNSGKHPHQASKKSQDKKLTVMAEEQILPFHVSEEQFLHNHQECIKAQRNAKPLTGIIFGCYWTRQGWLLNAVGLSTVREIEA